MPPPDILAQCSVPPRIKRNKRPREEPPLDVYDVCQVHNCSAKAHFYVKFDNLGVHGYRCFRHGRMCTVDGCTKPGKRDCPDDKFGIAGIRCPLHGGGNECAVEGCGAIAWRRKDEADKFGPGGYRCSKHAQPCNVANCTKAGQRKHPADMHGPDGYRCNSHCSMTHTEQRSRGRSRDMD
eukprot:GEMP01042435.1.p1 GENE.GEMP01042435.1~~GEMP01042435.1.p1  ORF type:complete len:202 (+),score=21.85 GEMP01042435.1:69-608(+)